MYVYIYTNIFIYIYIYLGIYICCIYMFINIVAEMFNGGCKSIIVCSININCFKEM